jgi:hypothetical protein
MNGPRLPGLCDERTVGLERGRKVLPHEHRGALLPPLPGG